MKKCCSNQNPDRISYLPDPVRSHIVSFLPMRDAIRTSILSKQWRHIYYSLSRLEFDQYDFTKIKHKAADFRDFVDRIVICHDGSDIQKFSLKTRLDDEFISSSRVRTWVSFALQHNVQELEMWMYYGKITNLPFRFFTCMTLRVLSLVCVEIEWPTTVRFPVLKYLYVEGLSFVQYENTIDKLFSSCTCPMLEDLVLRQCDLGVSTLSICNPSLKYLQIFDGNQLNINISVSTLHKLECIWCLPPNISSETLSSLSDAYFELSDSDLRGTAVVASQFNSVSKILLGLHNVKTLELDSTFIEFLSRGRDLLPASLPLSCCSLKHLSLGLLFRSSIHIQVIKLLLRSYPHLETLVITVEREEYDWHLEASTSMNLTGMEDHSQLKKLAPGDTLDRLRMLEVREFEGSDSEIELVRYLLENANFLEKMNLSKAHNQQSAESQMKESEMMLAFAKVAPRVKISLS
ncbi:hypothetical protein AQUCO_00300225v1 [Aquilegia coerulea]|uniref:F-box domain-containing protein n=1 Tax=Aquilegia coerulea TaxID=218851 RepID=A0A2G5EXX8_AQUCA|nr:hypothetical protein AQUCO_00300225v1 [Aquilegia coerulea]